MNTKNFAERDALIQALVPEGVDIAKWGSFEAIDELEAIEALLTDTTKKKDDTTSKKKTYASFILDLLSRGGSAIVVNAQEKIVEDKTNVLPKMKKAAQLMDKSDSSYEIERLEAPTLEDFEKLGAGIEVIMVTTDGVRIAVSPTSLMMFPDIDGFNKEDRERNLNRSSGANAVYAAMYKIHQFVEKNPDQAQKIILSQSLISSTAKNLFGNVGKYDEDKDLAGANFRFIQTMLEGVEDVPVLDTVKPASIEDMIEDTVTEYSAEEDAPVSQIDDLLLDTLEEAADQGEGVTFMNEKEMKDTVNELDVDSEIVQDNKENVSKETSKKTQKRIKRLKCPNRGV